MDGAPRALALPKPAPEENSTSCDRSYDMTMRKHASLNNHKTMSCPGPLFSLREQVGGPGVCIHPRGWKYQFLVSQTILHPRT